MKIVVLLDRDGQFIKTVYIPILNNDPVVVVWRGRYFVHLECNIYKESMTLIVEEG